MGEAIIANLKAKSGKDLDEWRAELAQARILDPAAAHAHLRALGLGQFQALTVVERVFARDQYADEQQLVADHFARHGEQRALYDYAVTQLAAHHCTPKPCRGYLPLYRDGRIAISFKATSRGLYAALTLSTPEHWPDRVVHKRSMGGSERLRDGVYLADLAAVTAVVAEVGRAGAP